MNQVLSVIVPIYNKEKYVEKCVNSIQKWGGCRYEVILIDDGSTDHSDQIVDEMLKDEKQVGAIELKVIHTKNQGVSAARNLGIDKATGDWITFVDADDEVVEGSLNDVFEVIKEDNTNDVVICGAIKKGGDEKGKILPDIEFTANDKEVLKFAMTGGISNIIPKRATVFIGGCKEKFYRRSFLLKNNIRFESKLKRWEDVLYSLQCYEYAKGIRLLSDTVYIMNIDPSGITHNMQLAEIMQNADYFLHYCHDEKIGLEVLSADEIAIFEFTTSLTILYEAYKARKKIGTREYSKLISTWFSNSHRKEMLASLKTSQLSKPKAVAAILCKLHLYYLVGLEMDINNRTRRV